MNPKVFEPHNGYGGNDPDGEPWPFGYISEDYGRPIFELRPLFVADYGELHAAAIAMAAASDLLEALRRLTDQVAGYGTTDAGLVQAARAAIARATGEPD